MPGVFRKVAAAMPEGHPKSAMSRARRFVAGIGLAAAQRYAQYVGLFDREAIERMFPQGAQPRREVVAEVYAELERNRDRVQDRVQAAAATDRLTYLPEDLLTKLDRASMLHALEVRSPFMDHDLVRLAAGFTTAQLLGGGAKRMLREAFAKDLPDWVFERKKMGFAVPIGEWLRGPLRAMLQDLLFAKDSFAAANFHQEFVQKMVEAHCAEKEDHSQSLYALIMLELWWGQRIGAA